MLLFHPLDVIDVTLDYLSSRQVRTRRAVEKLVHVAEKPGVLHRHATDHDAA